MLSDLLIPAALIGEAVGCIIMFGCALGAVFGWCSNALESEVHP